MSKPWIIDVKPTEKNQYTLNKNHLSQHRTTELHYQNRPVIRIERNNNDDLVITQLQRCHLQFTSPIKANNFIIQSNFAKEDLKIKFLNKVTVKNCRIALKAKIVMCDLFVVNNKSSLDIKSIISKKRFSTKCLQLTASAGVSFYGKWSVFGSFNINIHQFKQRGHLWLRGKGNWQTDSWECIDKKQTCTIQVDTPCSIVAKRLVIASDCITTIVGTQQQPKFDIINLQIATNAHITFDYINLVSCSVNNSGTTEWNHSTVDIPSITQNEGLLKLNDSTLSVANNLLLNKGATLKINHSKLTAQKTILQGHSDIAQSILICSNYISAINIHSQQNQFFAAHNIRFSGKLTLSEDKFLSERLNFSGEIDAEKLLATAVQSINFNLTRADIHHSGFKTKIFTLKNLDKNTLKFCKSYLEIQCFFQQGKAKFFQSQIKGIDDKTTSHTIDNHLVLSNTHFESEGQIFVSQKGKLVLKKQSQLKAGNIYSEGNIRSHQSRLASDENLMQIKSLLSIQQSDIKVAQQMATSQQSRTTLRASKITSAQFHHHGSLKVRGKNTSTLDVTEKLTTHPDSNITGTSLAIEAHHWNHQGTIHLSDQLIARGNWLADSGDITATQQIFLGFDRGGYHTGRLTADSIDVCIPIFSNFFGRINARSYRFTGLLSTNLGGVYSTNHQQTNSVVSLNAGLTLPHIDLSRDISTLFSWDTVFAISQGLTNRLGYGQYLYALQLAKHIGSTLVDGNFWHNLTTISTADLLSWQKLTSRRLHEWLPTLHSVKNNALLFANTYHRLNEYQQQWQEFKENCHSYKNDVSFSNFAQEQWQQLQTSVGGMNYKDFASIALSESARCFGGSTVRNSLFSLESGISITQNYAANGLWLEDYSANFALRNSSITTWQFNHYGFMYGDTALITARQADLQGSANLSHAHFTIDKFQQAENFIRGDAAFAAYQFQNSLAFATKKELTFTEAFNRQCDTSVTGTHIDMQTDYKHDNALSLTSTVGDVDVAADIESKHLNIHSAQNVTMNKTIRAKGNFTSAAKGEFHNIGGDIEADNVWVKATAVNNITKGATTASQYQDRQFGESGRIHARNRSHLQATQANVANHGGELTAGKFLAIKAEQDIENIANEKRRRGKHDIEKDYQPACIIGGTGENTQNLGLSMQAKGKCVNDASTIASMGDGELDCDQGLVTTSRQHQFISRNETIKARGLKKLFKKKKHIVETSIKEQRAQIVSKNGKMIVRCKKGGVESKATDFFTQDGTDFYCRDRVHLGERRGTTHHHVKKTSLWGLKKSRGQEMHEHASLTHVHDNGHTRIHSESNDVDLRGARITGEQGDLTIVAHQGTIRFGQPILNDYVKEEQQRISLEFPLKQAAQELKQGNLQEAAVAADPLVAKGNALTHSNNSLEATGNAANVAIEAANVANAAARGIANDSLDKEAMARYGLGGEEGFNPAIKLRFEKTKREQHSQRTADGGIHRRNISLTAQEVNFDNGVTVRSSGNTHIDAPKINFNAAELAYQSHEHRRSYAVGMTAQGDVTDAEMTYSSDKLSGKSHVNARLVVDEKLTIRDNAAITLDGGNIEAKDIAGNNLQISIRSRQDTMSAKSKSFSVGSSGNLHYQRSRSEAKRCHQVAGIHVQNDIDSEQFSIDTLQTQNGEITSDGKANIKANTVIVDDQQDSESHHGFAVSLNVFDLARVANQQEPTNQAGEQAIATATVTVDDKKTTGTQQSTIHGARGTNAEIRQQQGHINTTNRDGYLQHSHSEYHIIIDVPITNKAHLEQARKNITAAKQKLAKQHTKSTTEQALLTDESKTDDAEQALSETEKDPEVVIDNAEQSFEKQSSSIDNSIDTDKQIMTELLAKVANEVGETNETTNALLKRARQELEQSGTMSAATQQSLKKTIIISLTKILKETYDHRYAKVLEALKNENIVIQAIPRGKGFLVTLALNLATGDGTLKDATLSTVSDTVIGAALGFFFKGSAGTVSAVLLGIEILDSFYDEEKNLQTWDLSREFRQQMQQADSWSAKIGYSFLARDCTRAAAGERGVHILNTGYQLLQNKLKQLFSSAYDKAADDFKNHDPNKQFHVPLPWVKKKSPSQHSATLFGGEKSVAKQNISQQAEENESIAAKAGDDRSALSDYSH